MNFDLTEEQQLLADTARDVLSRSYDTESRNKIVDVRAGLEPRRVASAGRNRHPRTRFRARGVRPDRDHGRDDRDRPPAGARTGRRGRAHPGRSDRRTRQRRAARAARRGGRRGEAAGPGPPRAGPARLPTSCRPAPPQQGGAWTITGRKNPVLAGDSADVLVVTAALPGGGVGPVPGRRGRRPPGSRYRTFDGQRGAEIVFDGAAAQPLGDGGDVSDRIHATLIRYSVGAVRGGRRRDGRVAAADDGLPEGAQAVRRAAEDVPDAHAARRRHVRLTRAGAQHELLRGHVASPTGGSTRWSRRAPSCRSAARDATSRRSPSRCTAVSASPPSTRWRTTRHG